MPPRSMQAPPAAVRDVQRAVRPDRQPVRAPAGLGDGGLGAVGCDSRDPPAAQLGDEHAPVRHPHRPLGELQAVGDLRDVRGAHAHRSLTALRLRRSLRCVRTGRSRPPPRPRGQPSPRGSRVICGTDRFRAAGFGPEYLDQIVDGAPVGARAERSELEEQRPARRADPLPAWSARRCSASWSTEIIATRCSCANISR